MAWTQQDYDTLKSAVGSGARRVRYMDGKEVEYHSLDAMRSLLAEMHAELNAATAGGSRVMPLYFAAD